MARAPFIAQMAVEECAPTCLAMVLGAYGHHVSLAEVRDNCGAGRSGTTAYDLLMAAKAYGLEGQGLAEVEPRDLAPMLREGPVILHWGLGHMVVCDRVSRDGLAILDPALGSAVVGWAEADRKMSGVVLVFRPGPSFVLKRPGPRPLAAYLAGVWSDHSLVLTLLGAGLVAQLLAVLPSLAVGIALDQGAGSPTVAAIAGIAGLGLGSLTGNLLDLLRGLVAAKVGARENERFYGRVLERLFELPLGWLQARGTGEIMVRLTQIQTVLGEATTALLGLLSAAFASLACLLALWFISPVVAGYALVAGGLLVPAVWHFAEQERLRKRPFLLGTGRLGHEAVETVKVLSWIEMAGLGAWARESLVLRVKSLMGHAVVSGEQAQGVAFKAGALNALLSGGLVAVTGLVAMKGGMTLGQVAAVVALGAVFVAALGSVVACIRGLRAAANTMDRADDILQAEGECRGKFSGVLDGAVAACGVDFSYWPAGDLVVQGLDLDLRPGEMVGLVGPSGCGKSTMGALIAGVRLPTVGEIRLSGIPTSDWEEGALRRQIGYALQAPEVLAGSVRLNLGLGREFDEAVFWDALACACLDSKIRTLGGLDALMQPGGRNLSGGERQRLALARVVVGKPALLVLDEATSAVDLALEAEIHRNLRSLRATRLLITHRRGSLALADRIIEMKGGRLG